MCLETFNNIYKALDQMRSSSVVPDTETNEEMRQRVTEDCKWFVKRSTVQLSRVGLVITRRANARNVSFQSLYGGQFSLSTQLINPKFSVSPPHRRSTTVSLEATPPPSCLDW